MDSHKKQHYATCSSIVRLQNLHRKNARKIKNAYSTTNKINETLVSKKDAYETHVMSKHQEKIKRLMESSHEKLKVIKKMHQDQQTKAEEIRNRKHKSLLSESMKMRNRELMKMQNA